MNNPYHEISNEKLLERLEEAQATIDRKEAVIQSMRQEPIPPKGYVLFAQGIVATLVVIWSAILLSAHYNIKGDSGFGFGVFITSLLAIVCIVIVQLGRGNVQIP